VKSSVATASRDVLRIKLRAADFHAFNLLGRVAPWTAEREGGREVVLYPAFDSAEAFGDVLNRLGWYFPDGTVDALDLTASVRGDIGDASTHAPEAQGTFETDHLPLSNVDPRTLDERARSADSLLVWDADARLSGAVLRNAANVDVVDPAFYSHTEPVTWGEVSAAARSGLEDRSRGVYESLERRAEAWDESYVFATGPSLDRAFEREFPEDALSVICNSIVRNDDLLDHLQPDVLTFADPVFHFGPSRYAVRFREDAVRAIREYDLVAVVPEEYRELLVGHYPELADRVVGIRSVYDDTFRFPTSDSLEVMGTANIMTKLMLPVASALTDHVRIVGADGRKEDESYFWEHSDIGQYDDELMNTAFETHPAFFRDRVYTDYYQEHVDILTDMIEYGEKEEVEYESVTPSYIPCLNLRTIDNTL
jgi:hypothetical protein